MRGSLNVYLIIYLIKKANKITKNNYKIMKS